MKTHSIMTHRMTVERNTPVSDNGGGFTESWTSVENSVPCFAWLASGQQLVISGRPQIIDARIVLTSKGTDVREGDRLSSVTDRKGKVLFDGPLHIDSVGERLDHLRLTTRRIT